MLAERSAVRAQRSHSRKICVLLICTKDWIDSNGICAYMNVNMVKRNSKMWNMHCARLLLPLPIPMLLLMQHCSSRCTHMVCTVVYSCVLIRKCACSLLFYFSFVSVRSFVHLLVGLFRLAWPGLVVYGGSERYIVNLFESFPAD